MPKADPFVDGKWKRVPKRWLHGCCDCRLMHFVDMKKVGGRFYMRWTNSKVLTKYWRQQGW